MSPSRVLVQLNAGRQVALELSADAGHIIDGLMEPHSLTRDFLDRRRDSFVLRIEPHALLRQERSRPSDLASAPPRKKQCERNHEAQGVSQSLLRADVGAQRVLVPLNADYLGLERLAVGRYQRVIRVRVHLHGRHCSMWADRPVSPDSVVDAHPRRCYLSGMMSAANVDALMAQRDANAPTQWRALGRLFAAARGALGLRAKQVAVATGLADATVRATEKGAAQPHRSTIRLMGAYYASHGIVFELDPTGRCAVRVDKVNP